MGRNIVTIISIFLCFYQSSIAQNSDSGWWHGIHRELRYRPDGNDFVIENGNKRFNRALYGGNTAFRAEAGDLPEFALYLPGMGGNLKFGVIAGEKSKWLINAEHIEARYRPGSMIYTIRDSILGNGSLTITALCTYDMEALMIRVETKDLPVDIHLLAAYGGITGTKFSRDGDIGADPESSFYLKPENCKGNVYDIDKYYFKLSYAKEKIISGVFPTTAHLRTCSAEKLNDPLSFFNARDSLLPALAARMSLNDGTMFFFIKNGSSTTTYGDLPVLFFQTEKAVKDLSERIIIKTPDPYINTLGGALSVAADAIWEDPSYMHGAVAWRMRLNGWRGAYAADVLGWHDRARKHFNGYAQSQITTPASAPVVMDTALHLARHLEKLGTALFSSGYISRNPGGDLRAHHYDMNLVFIDQLLDHFLWTGDTAYVRQCWSLLQRHLAWEKRNFDADGDGLYDAYAAIWASDALQYSGGGVTHSSAYNYRANKMAAELAVLIHEDPMPYKKEADKILRAINTKLWMPSFGWYAEYKDLKGLQRLHQYPGLWTVYHAIDEGITDPFQAYQSLQYVDKLIPHIPVKAKGLNDTGLYLLSTTDWQPYTWSLNNVVLAENMHTALAYWKGGRSEEAFTLWKSTLIESMYLGASPGNFQQLSFYDAIRGELYRDFADGIGITAKSLIEGLFGISPDALHDILYIHPGFPKQWDHASIKTPDIDFSFEQNNKTDHYHLISKLPAGMFLQFSIPARFDEIEKITVNGEQVKWKSIAAIGYPKVEIIARPAMEYSIEIIWKGKTISFPVFKTNIQTTQRPGFFRVKQGQFSWWQPIHVKSGLFILPAKDYGYVKVNGRYDKIDLTGYFNDKVTNIFSNQYLSPRPTSPTLQLPTQAIGNWAYPLTTTNINDSGFRKKAGPANEFVTKNGAIPFSTPSDFDKKNIVFTSLWDNYPDSIKIPLSGKAMQAYFLLAGSTNTMQSRFTNGIILVRYKNGTTDLLFLNNPENWWPIEQDYYEDGYAFTTGAPKPLRVYLKTGEDTQSFNDYTTIRGYSNRAIDGGAATILSLPLDPQKELQSIVLRTTANDVVIGLMGVTLQRSLPAK